MELGKNEIVNNIDDDSLDGSYFRNIFKIIKSRIDELAKTYQ